MEDRSSYESCNVPEIEKLFNKLERYTVDGREGIRLPVSVLSDRMLIRPIEDMAFRKSKLQLPGGINSQEISKLYYEMPLQGIIVGLGPGFMTDSGLLREYGLKIGDHVCVQMSGAMVADFVYNGILYYDVRQGSVVCIYDRAAVNRWPYGMLKFLKG